LPKVFTLFSVRHLTTLLGNGKSSILVSASNSMALPTIPVSISLGLSLPDNSSEIQAKC